MHQGQNCCGGEESAGGRDLKLDPVRTNRTGNTEKRRDKNLNQIVTNCSFQVKVAFRWFLDGLSEVTPITMVKLTENPLLPLVTNGMIFGFFETDHHTQRDQKPPTSYSNDLKT